MGESLAGGWDQPTTPQKQGKYWFSESQQAFCWSSWALGEKSRYIQTIFLFFLALKSMLQPCLLFQLMGLIFGRVIKSFFISPCYNLTSTRSLPCKNFLVPFKETFKKLSQCCHTCHSIHIVAVQQDQPASVTQAQKCFSLAGKPSYKTSMKIKSRTHSGTTHLFSSVPALD